MRSRSSTRRPGFHQLHRYDNELVLNALEERSGEPVSRSVETEEAPVEHDAWVIAVLLGELHMSAGEVEGLSEEAIRLVHDHWARVGNGARYEALLAWKCPNGR